MTRGSGTNRLERSVRTYRRLLAIFPAPFRERFGEEMVQTFRDSLRDAQCAGPQAVAAFWLRTLLDTALSGAYERIALISGRTASRLQDLFPSGSIASILKFGVGMLGGQGVAHLSIDAVKRGMSPSGCAGRLLLATIIFGVVSAVISPSGWTRYRWLHIIRSLGWASLLIFGVASSWLHLDGRLSSSRFDVALWVPIGALGIHRLYLLAKSFSKSLKLARARNAECKAHRSTAGANWRVRIPRSCNDLHNAWVNVWALDRQVSLVEKKPEGYRSLRLPHQIVALLLTFWLIVAWPDLNIVFRAFTALAILINGASGVFPNVDDSPQASESSTAGTSVTG